MLLTFQYNVFLQIIKMFLKIEVYMGIYFVRLDNVFDVICL